MAKKSVMNRREKKKLLIKTAMRFSLVPLFLALTVLIPSGTWKYWQAYVYFAVLVIPMAFVLSYFMKNDPRFLVRRTRAVEKEKWQKILAMFSLAVFLAGYIVPGLDRRFGWSMIPAAAVIAADIIVILGYTFIFFVFRQNSYASRIVEVEKKQKVISTGLYGMVRHPMYLGVLIMFLPVPVALGSYWGLIPMAFLPVILVLRLINEEKVLLKNLKGYKEYCRKVRYRLIPYVW